MSEIRFTATTFRMEKACYFARADELSMTAGPATTERGAVRKLKDAVLEHFHQLAREGRLAPFLASAGYHGSQIALRDVQIECQILDTHAVLLPIPHQLGQTDYVRRKRGAKGRTHGVR